MLSKCPGKKDIFKELRVRFVIIPKIIISEYFFVSSNFLCYRVVSDRSIFNMAGSLGETRPCEAELAVPDIAVANRSAIAVAWQGVPPNAWPGAMQDTEQGFTRRFHRKGAEGGEHRRGEGH